MDLKMGDYYILAGIICVLTAIAFFVILFIWINNKKRELKQRWKD